MTDLYETLGVDRDATDEQIAKAYRAKARKHHPDRPDGDAESFKLIAVAFEVLNDAKARQHYDATGEMPGAKSAASEIEQQIAALLESAFLQDGQDPIRWMCNRIDQERSQCRKVGDSLRPKLKKLRSRIERFRKANESTTNAGARDFIAAALESQARSIELQIARTEEGVEHYTEMLTYLNDLRGGMDPVASGFASLQTTTGSVWRFQSSGWSS